MLSSVNEDGLNELLRIGLWDMARCKRSIAVPLVRQDVGSQVKKRIHRILVEHGKQRGHVGLVVTTGAIDHLGPGMHRWLVTVATGPQFIAEESSHFVVENGPRRCIVGGIRSRAQGNVKQGQYPTQLLKRQAPFEVEHTLERGGVEE